MNPQFMNQQPSANISDHRPTNPAGFNGPPPGQYGAPPQPGYGAPPQPGYGAGPVSTGGPPTFPTSSQPPSHPISNGPSQQPAPLTGGYGPPPTKGAPMMANGPQPTGMPTQQMPPPMRYPTSNAHHSAPNPPQPNANQLSGQMRDINLGPPSSVGPTTGGDPRQNNPMAPDMRAPIRQPGMPATSQYGAPPPQSMARGPPSSAPLQAGVPPLSAPPQAGVPPHSAPPQAGVPPLSAPPQAGVPPHSAPPHAGVPPLSAPPQAGVPPLSAPPQAGVPPPSSVPPQPSVPAQNSQPYMSGAPPPPSSQSFKGAVPPPSSQSYIGGGPPPPSSSQPFAPGVTPPSSYMAGVPSSAPSSQSYMGGVAPPGQAPQQPPAPAPMGGPPPAQMPGAAPPHPAMPAHTGQHPPPPSPGHQRPPPGQFGQQPPGYGGQPAAPQQPPRRLDPDQMPSPIQVIEDDKRSRGGVFQATQTANVPPLVTTSFTSEDQGSCNPRFLRSTMYNIPATSDMMKQCHLPFAINVTPFAKLHPLESEPPLVDLGVLGPIRCNRCKAYMCPNMQFTDGGRRFQCCFCGCSTEVPAEYFAHLDHTGRRIDAYERPELHLGTYEFVATSDYCKDNKLPSPPAFIFMIDVSYNSVKSGLVRLLCDHLKEDVLVNLPREQGMEESEIRVGFVTYAKELHFYNVKGSLAQPQMLVVSDIQDVFVPLLDGFLVKLSESEAVIDSLLSQIPAMFAESRETEVVLGPVIQAGLDALKSAGIVGKLFVFHSSLPSAEAPGKLKNRDDRKLLGTDKEKTVLTPQGSFYTTLGQQCVAVGCSVDLYLFPNSFMDIATVAEVPRLTGGAVYKYTYFQADIDGMRLIADLKNNVSRPIAFDTIMRLRTSTGIRPVDFLGNFYMSNTTDVELAVIDCDKSVTVEMKHDDKLSDSEGAFLQAAVLYTSCTGQRRLRILNMAFAVCTQMSDLFRNCELDVLINYLAKLSIRQSMNTTPKQVREDLMNRCAHILACYRKNCASPSSAGQLILPECMKLLPVYTNCIIKSGILQGGADISIDERSYVIHTVNAMNVRASNVFFYSRLIPLHDLDTESSSVPTAVRCSYERLRDNGVYLLENSLVMFMWIGHNVSPQWIQNVFAVQSAAQIDIDRTRLQDLDNAVSRRVRTVIRRICEERNRHMKLVIVRQRDKLEPVFQQFLMEDRSASGSSSYVDFLCHIHKEIRNLLT